MGCMEHRMAQDHKNQIKKNKALHSTLTQIYIHLNQKEEVFSSTYWELSTQNSRMDTLWKRRNYNYS